MSVLVCSKSFFPPGGLSIDLKDFGINQRLSIILYLTSPTACERPTCGQVMTAQCGDGRTQCSGGHHNEAGICIHREFYQAGDYKDRSRGSRGYVR